MQDCDVGACSVTCGPGTSTCERTCVNGIFGDVGCPYDQQTKTEECLSNDPCGKPENLIFIINII